MKKKVLSLTLVVCLLAIAVVGGTLAYFTDTTEVKENVFTVGNVNIDLTEPSWGTEESEDVYPGEALPKDPTVTNIGDNPCFVRVSVTGLDQFGDKGMITLRHGDYVEGYDTDNWTYYEGYYYYNKPLVVKDTENNQWNTGLVSVTPPLFNQIVMPAGLDGTETAVDSIDVYAQAVQAQGARASWGEVKAMTVPQIAEWFATCAPEAPVEG